jgi:trypsin
MFRLILIAVVLPFIAAVPLVRPRYWVPEWRIVGGNVIGIEDAPYQISLQLKGSSFHTCGGSIIAPNLILTAAHCTDGSSASRFQIRAGSEKYSSGGVQVNVEKIFQHEKFDYFTIDFDYSILKLESSLEFSDKIKPVKLAGKDQKIPDGTNCTVTGWGNTQSSQESREILRAAFVPKFSHEKCNEAYKSYGGITDRMICAGFPSGGVDACQGELKT